MPNSERSLPRSRVYTRSPVVQAEINLYVPPHDAVTLEALLPMQSRQKRAYPERRLWTYERGAFGEEELLAQPDLPVSGYSLTSPKRPFIVQARIDGMAVVQLPPYRGWEPLRAEAQRQWDLYRSIVDVEHVGGIAVRFANRFNFSTPVDKLSEYFRTFPQVSDEMPSNALSDFAMNLEIPQDDLPAVVLVSQRVVRPSNEEIASIMLYISVIHSGDVSGDAEVWDLVARLHDRERDVFEACIGERAREMIA